MEAPQVLRTDSQLLSEQFSVPLKTARQTLNSCNNDLAKAGKKLLQSLMTSENATKPDNWITQTTKSTPKQHEIASVSWKYNDLANSQELVVCFDATSTLALEKAYNNQEDGLILTSSREDSYVDLKRMLITTSTSTKSIYREIIEPRSISFLPPKQWRSSEVVCTSIDSTTRQLVSGHVDGTSRFKICSLTLTQLLLNTYTNFFILLFNHLLYRHLLYCHLLYRHLLYCHLLYRH
jgi:hypothetical protein